LTDPATLDFWVENLSIIVCVVKPEKGQNTVKEIPSTEGMALSLITSELMKHGRLAPDLASKHIKELIEALNKRDFAAFAEITIKESNQLHAICQDTYPSITYMNEYSR